jgi:threonine/homoserine/homoserine lactone efflux protein
VLAVVLSLTPGPDDVLVVRSAVRGGPRLGAATTLGVALGTSVWGVAAAVGLAAAVARSATAYDVVRLAGAGYLVVLGSAPLLARALGRARAAGPDLAPTGGRLGIRAAFLTGLVGDVLNPRIGIFYLAVVPQFVPAGAPTLQFSLLLCAVDVAVATAWLLGLAWCASAAVAWLRRPAVVGWSQGVFSAVLVGLGTFTALGL